MTDAATELALQSASEAIRRIMQNSLLHGRTGEVQLLSKVLADWRTEHALDMSFDLPEAGGLLVLGTHGEVYSAPSDSPALALRTRYLTENVGGVTALARMLRVSKSQPSRWRTGQETPSPEKARELLDLDHVVARAQLVWADKQVVLDWLNSANAYLGGATPLDVIRTRGVTEVIDALDQVMAGAYA